WVYAFESNVLVAWMTGGDALFSEGSATLTFDEWQTSTYDIEHRLENVPETASSSHIGVQSLWRGITGAPTQVGGDYSASGSTVTYSLPTFFEALQVTTQYATSDNGQSVHVTTMTPSDALSTTLSGTADLLPVPSNAGAATGTDEFAISWEGSPAPNADVVFFRGYYFDGKSVNVLIAASPSNSNAIDAEPLLAVLPELTGEGATEFSASQIVYFESEAADGMVDALDELGWSGPSGNPPRIP
ncbi:MAG: hypothetical protein KC561_21490, partial [Myxococcales bacterium]|nr:hypothetical protein [Myxococcales bacterium]